MTTKRMQIIIGAIVIILVGAGAFWLSLSSHIPTPAETLEPVATTTPDEAPATTPAVKRGLPPEPVFVLPAGASAVDEYAFLLNDKVNFRSLTSTTSLEIPNSDAGSFEKLSAFMTYPGNEIVSTCGVSGTYGYYADERQVYFYQFWRAPKFRSSRVEVIVGAKKREFEVTSPLTAESKDYLYTVEYRKATTTCEYYLNRTDA